MMQSVKLNQVCKILNGYAFKSEEYQSEGVPLLRISNFDGGEVVVDDKSIYVDQSFLKTKTDFIVEKGDILIALSGATTGKYGIYNYDFPSLLNQRIGLIKSSASSKLSGKYFYHFLNILKDEILRKAGGAAQPNISTKTIGELEIPLPPLPQQQKIANILDAADALRQNDKALIAKYDELTQALFLDMFGDPVSNPKGWEKVELKKLLKNVNKIGRDFNIKNIQYVDISSIDNSKFMITSTTNYQLEDRPSRAQQILENGDVLLATVRPNLKNIAINIVDGFIASTGFYVCRCNDKINNRFLFEVLKSDSVTNYFVGITAGANYPAVKSSDVSKFLICLPQIELQNQFAERVAVIEELKAIAQKSLEKSEELFNSLLQKAFKGELN